MNQPADNPATDSGGSFADLALDTDLADDFSVDDVPDAGSDDAGNEEQTPPAAPVVTQENTPATPPAAQPAPVAPVQPPVASAPPAPAAAPPPPTAAPAPSNVDPAAPPAQPPVAPDWAKLRKEAVDAAAQQYQISEEDTRLLMTEPERVLPRLMADAQLRATEVAIRTMMQQLPAVLKRIETFNSAAKSAEDKFYGAWPGLKEHSKTVESAVLRYRNLYPDADIDTVIDEVGSLLSRRLKVAAPTPPAATPPAAPVAPRRPAGAAAVPATAPTKPPVEQNAFADLAGFELPDDE